jgi:peptidylprolyl isomerase
LSIFCHYFTTKGDITTQLEFENTCYGISLVEGKTLLLPMIKETFFWFKISRVIKDFMIQGGDPTGSGGGTAGYAFKDEVTGLTKVVFWLWPTLVQRNHSIL